MKTLPLLLSFTLAACAAPGPAVPEPMNFVDLERGSQANADERSFELVMERDRLEDVWRRIGAAPPTIDLTRNAVIAAFLGQRSSGGHSVAVTRVELHGDAVHVWVRVREPGPGCMTTQALTSPYHVVSIPLAAVPGASFSAEFHQETKRVNCQ